MKELLKVAEHLRQEIEKAGLKDPNQVRDLLKAAEGFEKEAKRVSECLREWRKDIN